MCRYCQMLLVLLTAHQTLLVQSQTLTAAAALAAAAVVDQIQSHLVDQKCWRLVDQMLVQRLLVMVYQRWWKAEQLVGQRWRVDLQNLLHPPQHNSNKHVHAL